MLHGIPKKDVKETDLDDDFGFDDEDEGSEDDYEKEEEVEDCDYLETVVRYSETNKT